jgi:hypothetical protein
MYALTLSTATKTYSCIYRNTRSTPCSHMRPQDTFRYYDSAREVALRIQHDWPYSSRVQLSLGAITASAVFLRAWQRACGASKISLLALFVPALLALWMPLLFDPMDELLTRAIVTYTRGCHVQCSGGETRA